MHDAGVTPVALELHVDLAIPGFDSIHHLPIVDGIPDVIAKRGTDLEDFVSWLHDAKTVSACLVQTLMYILCQMHCGTRVCVCSKVECNKHCLTCIGQVSAVISSSASQVAC